MPPTKSKPWLIQEAVVARLMTIDGSGDFWTNAGAVVYLGGAPELGDSDPDFAIAVVRLDEEPGHQMKNVRTVLPLELQAVAKADLDEPHVVVEKVLSDIKRVIETQDRTLGGLLNYMERGSTRRLERQPGSTTVGVGIAYAFLYLEGWGGIA